MERRNLELSSRNEGTRDKFQTNVIKFELDDILEHFINTINVITVTSAFDAVFFFFLYLLFLAIFILLKKSGYKSLVF